MFKFLMCLVLVLHVCCVLTVAAPNPAKIPEFIHKKSRGKGKGVKAPFNESECKAIEKKIADKKKNQKKPKGAEEMEGTLSRSELPHEDRQIGQIVAVIACTWQRSECNAAYELCIQTGLGCFSCWDECDDLRACADALGQSYQSWSDEGRGNSFECQERCGCMFEMDP